MSGGSPLPGFTPVALGDDHPRHRVRVLDTEMSYVETGVGDPIIFLHGNPTWSYVWRTIIPHVTASRRIWWEWGEVTGSPLR